MQVCEFIFTARLSRSCGASLETQRTQRIIIFPLPLRGRQWKSTKQLTLRKLQKSSVLWLQVANMGILLPEGLSHFAFRRPCPVECQPNEMQRIFHRGEAYSSGVSEKQKNKSSAIFAALR